MLGGTPVEIQRKSQSQKKLHFILKEARYFVSPLFFFDCLAIFYLLHIVTRLSTASIIIITLLFNFIVFLKKIMVQD